MSDFDWLQLLNPEFYINFDIGGVFIGLWIVLFIVFAETGLFAGFFLPGDSLLFLAGIYSRSLVENFTFIESDLANVIILSTLVAVAGILGNMVGYWFGAKSGYYLYKKEDSFWFKKKYLIQSKDFFEKYGGKAIIFARFLPIVRTFAPIVAGIVKMDKAKFTYFNVVGCLAWVASMLCAGHFLQSYILNQFQFDLKKHLEVIVIVIVFVTTAPVIFQVIKHRAQK